MPKLTPEQLKQRATIAAKARWAKKNVQDIRRGVSPGFAAAVDKARGISQPAFKFQPPSIPNGVVPSGMKSAVAMDYAPGVYDFANTAWAQDSYFQPFPGYPYLAGLATRAEYRNFADSLSSEITREWITLKGSTSSDTEAEQDKTRIAELEKAIKTYDIKGVIKAAAAQDCFFGRGQISINLRGANTQLPLVLSPATIPQGSLESFTTIEAMWSTPSAYNAIDPTAKDFYRPREWFVLGKQIHTSRLLTIITRPLPDMLKPAYNFGGVSLSQLSQPYVDNWLRTRQSVADLINNFSITALKTNMSQLLQGGDTDGSDVFARADLFTLTRSNRGLMLLDKDAEELVQINTPLSGLDQLQSQALEHLCTVSRIPAVILTGVSPSGLNASSEGEIRVFYDWIASQQEAYFRKPIETMIKIIMLDLWGEIDDTITFEFNPLWQISAKEQSEIRASNANTAAAYLDRGVLTPEEVREGLASDQSSGYSGIDATDVPEVETDPMDKTDLLSGITQDEWKEDDHPRAENGQFGSGGGGKKSVQSFRQENPKAEFADFAKYLIEQDISGEEAKKMKREFTESVKKERESNQAAESSKRSDEEKRLKQAFIYRIENSEMAESFTPSELDSIKFYAESGDRQGAQTEGRFATINAIERFANKNGIEIDHISESNEGKSKSLYLKVGGDIVRVSDHELPMTAQRESNKASGFTGRWNREVIVTDWMGTSLDDYIEEIKGDEKKP